MQSKQIIYTKHGDRQKWVSPAGVAYWYENAYQLVTAIREGVAADAISDVVLRKSLIDAPANALFVCTRQEMKDVTALAVELGRDDLRIIDESEIGTLMEKGESAMSQVQLIG